MTTGRINQVASFFPTTVAVVFVLISLGWRVEPRWSRLPRSTQFGFPFAWLKPGSTHFPNSLSPPTRVVLFGSGFTGSVELHCFLKPCCSKIIERFRSPLENTQVTAPRSAEPELTVSLNQHTVWLRATSDPSAQRATTAVCACAHLCGRNTSWTIS